MLLAVLGGLLVLISVALTLRALAADRRGPWKWARRHGAWAIERSGRLFRWMGARVAIAIAASLAALVAFASVAEDVAEYPTLAVDEHVRALVQARRTPAMDAFFMIFTRLGSSSVLFALVAATGVLLALRRSRRTALLAMAGPFVASLAIVGFKNLFQRERPEGALALGVHTYSFPSGHSSGSAASLLTIAYVLA